MAERPDIAPLIERLEQASEGDEDLDERVALAVGWTKHGTTFPDPCDMWHEPGMAAHVEHRGPPRYTTSLDAALTLVPEGWIVANLGQMDSGGWWAELRKGYQTSYTDVVLSDTRLRNLTSPVALSTAILKARAITGGAAAPSRD